MPSDSFNVLWVDWSGAHFKEIVIREFYMVSYLVHPAKVQVMMRRHLRHVVEMLSDTLLLLKWDWEITEIEI